MPPNVILNKDTTTHKPLSDPLNWLIGYSFMPKIYMGNQP